MELTTESTNPASDNLDRMTPRELVGLMNAEDARVAEAVALEADAIAAAIETIADRLARSGRLVYVGAGTSGRLGVLDASECPPTFNTDPEQVIGLIAGGADALQRAVEGAEDSREAAVADLEGIGLSGLDVVVGIAASGGTPYVLSALDYARSVGAAAIGFACNRDAPISRHAEQMIAVVVGPEVLAGSTRMKAGTATKMVLNMLTTGAMVRLGKTYGNLMVDLQATNEKLVHRATKIVSRLTGLSEDDAEALLGNSDGDVKTAVVSHHLSVSSDDARERLAAAGGNLRSAMAMQAHD